MAHLPNILQQDNLQQDVANFPHEYFTLECKSTRNFRDHTEDIAQEFSYTAVLKNSRPNTYLQSIIPLLFNLFESLIDEIKQIYRDFDYIRIFITHKSLTSCNIIIPPTFVKDMSPNLILQEIGRIIRSNNAIPADQQLQINVAAIRNLKGSSFLAITNIWNDLIKKRCILSIKNNDLLCLPRAIALGIAHNNYRNDPNNENLKRIYANMRKSDQGGKRGGGHIRMTTTLQKRTALDYLKRAQLPNREGIITDIPHYEEALGVGINVFSCSYGNKNIYKANENYLQRITLYHTSNIDGKGNGHFSVITKINSLVSRSYYCSHCNVGYNNKTKHHCDKKCNLCEREDCLKIQVSSCPECFAPCRSEECIRQHREKKKCADMLFCQFCHVRLKGFHKPERSPLLHSCGETFCSNCMFYYLEEGDMHRCYMKGTPTVQTDYLHDEKRFIFYDFESMQEGESEHIPNLVVSHSICASCEEDTQVTPNSKCNRCGSRCSLCDKRSTAKKGFCLPPCSNCAHREKIFSGPETVETFCQWLIHPQHKNTIVMAHNAKAYDAYFIYTYLIRAGIKPSIIFQGTKIMYCHIKGLNIKFLDSVNFLPMPLSALPHSFGLSEMKKGFFPHYYNTFQPKEAHLHHLPDVHYYDPDNMLPSRRREFFSWYEANYDKPFDFCTDLIEYCRSDVNILLNACWKFRKLIFNVTKNKVDAFQYVTIASICMGIFRTCFLQEDWNVLLTENVQDSCLHGYKCRCKLTRGRKINANASLEITLDNDIWVKAEKFQLTKTVFASSPIALLPPHGYSRRDRFSKQCTQWLAIFQKSYPEQITIQSAETEQGEKKVFYLYKGQHHLFRLDGYFKDSMGQEHALEFNGCYYHGCPSCFPNDRLTTMLGNKSLSARYQDTLFKQNMLKVKGYIVHTIWSCEFEKKLSLDPRKRDYISHLKIKEPLDIRDCYFGGRTNALVLTKTFQNSDEKAGYVDFCSLYPFALKYFSYPKGHPKRTTFGFLPLERTRCHEIPCSFFGKLCPGEHISLPYVGVIKVKILPPQNLYHPILPTRCNGKLMFPLCLNCAKNENVRGECHCTHAERCIEDTWCTPEVNAALTVGYKIITIYEILHWEEESPTLFDEYINTFLRFKAQASGFPENVITEQDQDKFIQEYYEKEGVHLEKSEISKNPGLRSIAKLALNSFYGKFGQRQNMKKYDFIQNADELYGMLGDVSKNLTDFHILSSDMMIVEYTRVKEFTNADPKTNVIISAFCSSFARLHLWKVMNFLGKRVLYHDTDSIIYSYTPEEKHPPLGEFLGDLTNELDCKKVGCNGCERGHWIDDFISCGPKNYAYHLNSGESFCKVRGFSLNYASSQIIHFQSMREALYSWYKEDKDCKDMITVTTRILRDKINPRIYTKKVSKKYSVVYNKRRVLDDYTTVPFGYK